MAASGRKPDPRAGAAGEQLASRDVVCVDVRLDDLLDAHALVARGIEDRIHPDARIDDHGPAAVADEIAGTSQVGIDELPEDHVVPLSHCFSGE